MLCAMRHFVGHTSLLRLWGEWWLFLQIVEKQKMHEVEQWMRRVNMLEQERKAFESNAILMQRQILQLEEAKHILEIESGRMK